MVEGRNVLSFVLKEIVEEVIDYKEEISYVVRMVRTNSKG